MGQSQSSGKKKKGGRSNLIAYDANLMEFKNSFSMGEDLELARENSSFSGRSPISLRVDRSNRRFSGLDSPTFLQSETSRVSGLENGKGEDEEDKQGIETPIKQDLEDKTKQEPEDQVREIVLIDKGNRRRQSEKKVEIEIKEVDQKEEIDHKEETDRKEEAAQKEEIAEKEEKEEVDQKGETDKKEEIVQKEESQIKENPKEINQADKECHDNTTFETWTKGSINELVVLY